jgi:hypothetical protein
VPTFTRSASSSKMVLSREARGKRKVSSPPTLPPTEVDVAAMRQHRGADGERRSKGKEDMRRGHMPKTRELSRRGSPLPKRSRVIEVTTSEDVAEESEHSRGHGDREQSWRYVTLSPPFFHINARAHSPPRHC